MNAMTTTKNNAMRFKVFCIQCGEICLPTGSEQDGIVRAELHRRAYGPTHDVTLNQIA